MPHLRGAGTASCLAAMLHANHRHLGMEAVAVGAEALAFVCGTEDFITYRVRGAGGRGRGGWGRCQVRGGKPPPMRDPSRSCPFLLQG